MGTPTPKSTEAQAKADELARRDAASAAVGAQAVADAVKKAADVAAAAAQGAQRSADVGDFAVSGTPGGRFTLRGNGFGASGTVLLAGKQLETTEWGAQYIRGKLPADAKSGEIIVWVDPQTQQRGYLQV